MISSHMHVVDPSAEEKSRPLPLLHAPCFQCQVLMRHIAANEGYRKRLAKALYIRAITQAAVVSDKKE